MVTFNNVDGTKRIAAWLHGGIDKEAVTFAENFGGWLAENQLTTTQIRNIYGEIKRIQMQDADGANKADVLLLKPKLAYARARSTGAKSKDALTSLSDIMNAGVDAIFDERNAGDLGQPHWWFERFERFAQFFEAVIAYHRAKGGK